MMSRFNSDCGHTVAGANYGASGIIEESQYTRVIGKRVSDKLRALGHSVVDCTVDKASSNSESLNLRVKKSNDNPADLFFSIHFNAGGGNGTEVFTYGGKEFPQCRQVLTNMTKLGFKNRGIKDGSHLAVIKNTKAKSMLIEVCFIDSVHDVNLFTSNIDKVVDAIAYGILGQEVPKGASDVVKYDENPPVGANVLPGCKKAYIEETGDGRLIIHMDRGNYISLGKGECRIYLNDNNGKTKVHKFGL